MRFPNLKYTIAALGISVTTALVPWHTAKAASGLECDALECSLTVTDGLRFVANVEKTVDLGEQIEISGDVRVITPLTTLTLGRAELIFTARPEHPQIPFELDGIAQAPLAELPLFEDGAFDVVPMAAIGIASRDTLKGLLEQGDYKLPLAENPRDPFGEPSDLIEPAYLFFHVESGLALDLPLGEWLGMNRDDGSSPFSISLPGDESITFILDPSDPYFFMSKDARAMLVDGISAIREMSDIAEEINREEEPDPQGTDTETDQSDGDSSEDGTDTAADDSDDADKKENKPSITDWISLPDFNELAFSWLGGIPFQPTTTWGMPEGAGGFTGNLYVNASVPVYQFLEISGEVVAGISQQGFEIGGNGDLDVSLNLIPGFLDFSFPLGNASAELIITDEDKSGYFSGVSSPDYSFLPPVVPVTPFGETLVAGYVSTTYPQDTRLRARGQFGFDLSEFERLTGLSFNDLVIGDAELSLDIDGVWLRGKTQSRIHESIDFGGELNVEIYFSFTQPADSFVDLSGEMSVAGVGLRPVELRLDRHGLTVGGSFITPVSTISMDGSITQAGPYLSGTTEISFSAAKLLEKIEQARAKVIVAQQEVERLDGLITHMQGVVQAERDESAQKLVNARNEVQKARDAVNHINSLISYHHRKISYYRSQISGKYRWYKSQPWYKKSWAWGVYAGYAAAKNTAIAYHASQIGILEAARVTAQGVLIAAQGVLRALEETVETIPVNLDPRIVALIASKETALLALQAAEALLPKLPDIQADITGKVTFTLDRSGIEGTLSAMFNGTEITDGEIVLGANPKACIGIASLGDICTPF